MSREYRPNADRLLQFAGIAGLTAALFWIFALLVGSHWYDRGAGQLLSLIVAALAVWSLARGMDRRVLVRIGPEGLHHRDFSTETVPWSEITRVAVVHTLQKRIAWGKVTWVKNPLTDQINFAVAHPERYPGGAFRAIGRGLQRVSGAPPFVIQTYWLAGTTTADFVAEIRQHWPGTVEEINIPPNV